MRWWPWRRRAPGRVAAAGPRPPVVPAHAEPPVLPSELEAARTEDEVLLRITANATAVLSKVLHRRGSQPPTVVVVEGSRLDGQADRWATQAASAHLLERLVVVDADFLRRHEAALRWCLSSPAFLSLPYLRSDADMYGLVRRIEARGPARLRLRGAPGDRAEKQLAAFLLFVLAHEAGHLHDATNGSFTTHVLADLTIDVEGPQVLVRLCRHATDLAAHQFGLPGLGAVADPKGEVQQAAADLRTLLPPVLLRQLRDWPEEEAADAFAGELLAAHLDSVATDDAERADEEQYELICALSSAALYSWYADLLTFGRRTSGEGTSTTDLTMGFLDPRRQTESAVLFGDAHRTVLLRAALACEKLLRQRHRAFDDLDAIRLRHIEGESPAQWRLKESLQRYYLLCIVIDTAAKIAHFGCAAMHRTSKRQSEGPLPLLMVQFESIGQARERLLAVP